MPYLLAVVGFRKMTFTRLFNDLFASSKTKGISFTVLRNF